MARRIYFENCSKIIVLTGAGIRTADDVREVFKLGADATGSTSGTLKAKNPVEKNGRDDYSS